MKIWVLFLFSELSLLLGAFAEQCGRQAGGALCPEGLYCSEWGWCGTGDGYCGPGCQSQCGSPPPPPAPRPPSPPPAPPGGGNITRIISEATFNEMLKHRNDDACQARGFYTYSAFITAANSFPAFANTGDDTTRKREIAAFLAQTSHETTGGWPAAPGGPYAWGYCYNKEVNPSSSYCSPSPTYPCAPGKQYYGRGPIQLSWNYNYGQCGTALGLDLLNNPDLVATDPVISFESALWFWMTPQPPKPSCHDVIIGNWSPSPPDQEGGRVPGYGLITNIINGGLECGRGQNLQVEDRIGFYKRYCDILGIDYGNNLDCYNQRPFGNILLIGTV